jgi:hypothetical protein
MATHNSNITYADDTTVVVLITDGEETAYREVRELASSPSPSVRPSS